MPADHRVGSMKILVGLAILAALIALGIMWPIIF